MTTSRYGIRWRWLALTVLVVGVALAGALLVGCGTPEHRYHVLSFFFEGVPDPAASKAMSGGKVRSQLSGATIFVHRPYAENKCEECHANAEDIFSGLKMRKDVCVKCHPVTATRYEKMHGPVASGQCLICHAAHQSSEEHLLKEGSPRICTQCHELGTLSPLTPAHTDAKSACMKCHSGHGGNERYFLKVVQGGATTKPATRPVGNAALKTGASFIVQISSTGVTSISRALSNPLPTSPKGEEQEVIIAPLSDSW